MNTHEKYTMGINNLLNDISESWKKPEISFGLLVVLDASLEDRGELVLVDTINHWFNTRNVAKRQLLGKGGEVPELTDFQLGIVENGQCPFDGALLVNHAENVGFNEPGAEKIETTIRCPECGREY